MCCTIPLYGMSRTGERMEAEGMFGGYQGLGAGEVGSDCSMGMEFPFGVEKMFWN